VELAADLRLISADVDRASELWPEPRSHNGDDDDGSGKKCVSFSRVTTVRSSSSPRRPLSLKGREGKWERHGCLPARNNCHSRFSPVDKATVTRRRLERDGRSPGPRPRPRPPYVTLTGYTEDFPPTNERRRSLRFGWKDLDLLPFSFPSRLALARSQVALLHPRRR